MAEGEAPRLLKSVLAPTSYGLSTSESLTRPPLARGNMVFLEVDRRMPCRMNHEPLVDATRWNHTPKTSIFRHIKQFSLHPVLLVGSSQDDFSHLILLRALARFLSTSSSSCKRYLPIFSVSLKNDASITLVRKSASCAPPCTQRSDTFSVRNSLMARAFSCVRSSVQLGVAVRVMRSYRDLQSVAATLAGRF